MKMSAGIRSFPFLDMFFWQAKRQDWD